MALMDLKSNLSWYKKDKGFTSQGKESKYTLNDDQTSTTIVQGFSNIGNQVGFRQATSLDGFSHNDGDAKRLSQLGGGSKFPIGPAGELYTFDQKRFGFNLNSTYEDVYGNQSNDGDNSHFGLSKTYTDNSPIDDMYNKYNLRDDATPNSYIKHPLVLRGIQREGSADPQQWGLKGTPGVGGAFDIPRGGIITSAVRSAMDTVRISKFLVSPKGIGFLAKQFGYQLMNPNTENVGGFSLGLPATQLYNPLSSPIQAIGNFIGVHAPRHGIPFITGGPLGGGSEYEETKRKQAALNKASGLEFSRLENLRKEAFGIFPMPFPAIKGLNYLTTTGIKGPGSIFGLGVTGHKRVVDSTLAGQWGSDKLIEVQDYEGRQFKYGLSIPLMGKPLAYQTYKDSTVESYTRDDIDKGNNLRLYYNDDRVIHQNLRGLYEEDRLYGLDGFTTRYEWNTIPLPEQEIGIAISIAGVAGTVKWQDYIKFEYNYEKKYHSDKSQTGTTLDELDDRAGTDKEVPDDKISLKKRTAESTFKPLGGIVKRANNEAVDAEQKPLSPVADIKYYKTLDYPNLKKDSWKSFSAQSKYSTTETLKNKYGYKDYPLGERKNDPDSIQILSAFDDYGSEKDLINFKFQPLRLTNKAKGSEKPIIFRAYINTLDDSFQPSWDENQDQGRADAKIMLNGWARSISVDFIVPLHSKAEIKPVWNKLDELARLTYPIYGSSGFTGTYCKTTIGDLYKGVPMYVTDLSYSWDNETPWELSSGMQVPFYTNVSMTLGWIGTQRPAYNTKAFSFNGTA